MGCGAKGEEMSDLASVARELDSLAERLKFKGRPDHPDYISKERAAEWVSVLAIDVLLAIAQAEAKP